MSVLSDVDPTTLAVGLATGAVGAALFYTFIVYEDLQRTGMEEVRLLIERKRQAIRRRHEKPPVAATKPKVESSVDNAFQAALQVLAISRAEEAPKKADDKEKSHAPAGSNTKKRNRGAKSGGAKAAAGKK